MSALLKPFVNFLKSSFYFPHPAHASHAKFPKTENTFHENTVSEFQMKKKASKFRMHWLRKKWSVPLLTVSGQYC